MSVQVSWWWVFWGGQTEHYALLGPGRGLANPTLLLRETGQLLGNHLAQPFGRGSQENSQRKRKRPNLMATVRSGWESATPLQPQGAGTLMGVASLRWGQDHPRQPWCLDHFPIYSRRPGSLQFFPSQHVAECHLLRHIHASSFVSISHCQLEGKHGKRQAQSPADGAWPWGARASPRAAGQLPRLFLTSSRLAGRDLYFGFPFSEMDPLPQSELQPFIPPESHQIPLMPGASKGRSLGRWEGALEGSIVQGRAANLLPKHPLVPPRCWHRGSHTTSVPAPWVTAGKLLPWFSHTLVLLG